MPNTIGTVGDASQAAVKRLAQDKESGAQERSSQEVQQTFGRATHGIEERHRRQVQLVDFSKGQNLSVNA